MKLIATIKQFGIKAAIHDLTHGTSAILTADLPNGLALTLRGHVYQMQNMRNFLVENHMAFNARITY